VFNVLPSRFKVALVQPASYGPLLLGWAKQLTTLPTGRQVKNEKLKIEINNNFFIINTTTNFNY
jgi:hypothetical protein